MSRDRDARVYVGNLPSDIRQKELETIFDKYGKINQIDLKNGAGRGPPFAFIEFDDYRDAEDAIRAKNGYNFDGYSLRVEAPHGGRGGAVRGRGPPPRYDDRYGRGGYDRGYGGGGYYGRDRGYDRGYGRGSYDRGGYDRDRGYNRGPDRGRPSLSSRKTKFRVTITDLPENCSWQDLKDHMRDAGEVIYADVRGSSGVVEYENEDDMKYALKKLDDTEIKTHDGTKAYIRVKEERSSPSRSRSRSPARRRSPSPRKNSASPERSGSPPAKRSISRSPSQ